MVARRSFLTGGVIGSVLGALGSGAELEAAQGQSASGDSDHDDAKVAAAITALRSEVAKLRSFDELDPVRDTQITYLRVNGKFPDFLEVGTRVWFNVHDWHIRWQQPMTIGRDQLGRLTLQLNQTALIMRADAPAGFVGVPYDNR